MHDILLLKLALWTLLAVTAATLVLLMVATVNQVKGYSHDWEVLTFVQIAHLLIIGLAFLALLFLGHPLIALTCWRVLSWSSVIAGLIVLFINGLASEKAGVAIAAAISFVFAIIGQFLHGDQLAALPQGHPAYQPTSFSFALPSFYTWRTTGLMGLALLIAVFAFGFIRSARRDGLQFESNSGGLGGGSTSWQASPSLAYFAAIVLFCTLFVALLMHPPDGSTAGGVTTRAVDSKTESHAAK